VKEKRAKQFYFLALWSLSYFREYMGSLSKVRGTLSRCSEHDPPL